MLEALRQAKMAYDAGEVPVGAVVVYENHIIARAHNQTELLRDPTAHAEMIAITQAADALSKDGGPNHRGSLEKATLYVTMEPCPMCAGALVMSKCSHLVFGTHDLKAGACESLFNLTSDNRLNHGVVVVGGVLAEESRALLTSFFKNLRKDKR